MARIKPGDRKRAVSSPGSPRLGAAAELPPESAAADVAPSWTAGGWTQPPAPPSSRVTQVLTLAIMLHGALIVLSYLAVVRPSGVQGRVLDGFAPYLASLHLAAEANAADAGTAEGVSFFLARGEGAERIHRLQFKSTTDRSEEGWLDAEFGGAPGSGRVRRHQRFLTAVAGLGESEQNALVARLMLPLIESFPEAQMVRVIRLPNIMTDTLQEAEPAPYTAVILREQGAVRLVRVPPPRLSSAAASEEGGL